MRSLSSPSRSHGGDGERGYGDWPRGLAVDQWVVGLRALCEALLQEQAEEATTVTAEEEKTFWRVTRWALRNWESSPDYDDILSEALLEAWRSYRKKQEAGHPFPLCVVRRAAEMGPAQWLRRWVGRPGRNCAARLVPKVSFEDLRLLGRDEDECTLIPHSEGFETELVDRLAIWQQVERACTPRQVEVLRHIMTGLTMAETARVLGIKHRGVEFHYYGALARLRQQMVR